MKPDKEIHRAIIKISGIVQGVGFRPFVSNLARSRALSGFALNDSEGVTIEAQGRPLDIDRFYSELVSRAPPMARIASIEKRSIQPLAPEPETETPFRIKKSERGADAAAAAVSIAPDSAICSDCRAELFDPKDRRYRYPFITCVNCGPRLSISTGLPYDRPKTTMAGFELCERCAAEYSDHSNRRYHAQPIGCHDCGPRLTALDENFDPIDRIDPIGGVVDALKSGAIVAIKGIGGFHLAIDPNAPGATQRARERKAREHKPFALMVRDCERADELVELDERARAILNSPAREIALVPRRDPDSFPGVADGARELGVFTPYTPTQLLIFADGEFNELIMTSANVSDEPIVADLDEARARLSGIADMTLTDNRPISLAQDDSVVRFDRRGAFFIRRARGHAPTPIMAWARRSTKSAVALGVGAELKNSFCILKGANAYLSPHIGDLKYETLYRRYREALDYFQDLTASTKIDLIGADLHPQYFSTSFARELAERHGAELIFTQHHHAHMVAAMGENNASDRAMIGVIFDGAGLGLDGTAWGAEFFVGDALDFSRAGAFSTLALPGADKAVEEPWRIAFWLARSLYGKREVETMPFLAKIDRGALRIVETMIEKKINLIRANGIGRHFDLLAALLRIDGGVSHYEGSLATRLESIADRSLEKVYPYSIERAPEPEERLSIDLDATYRAIFEEIEDGVAPSAIAGAFHQTLIASSVEMLERIREQTGLGEVALAGGSFQNKILADGIRSRLIARGFKVYENSLAPRNDGSISLGQALIAAARSERSRRSRSDAAPINSIISL